MKVRIEFGRSRSASWLWVLRECRKQPSYGVTQEGGLEIHSVEYSDEALPEALVMVSRLRSWSNVNYYIDGKAAHRHEAWRRIYRTLAPRVEADMTLDQLNADLKRRGLRVSIRRSPGA